MPTTHGILQSRARAFQYWSDWTISYRGDIILVESAFFQHMLSFTATGRRDTGIVSIPRRWEYVREYHVKGGMGWSYAPTESTSSHPRRMIKNLVTDAMESLDTEPIADTIHSLSTWIAVYLNHPIRWVLLTVDLDRWQDSIAIESKESAQSPINWLEWSHWCWNGVFLRIA